MDLVAPALLPVQSVLLKVSGDSSPIYKERLLLGPGLPALTGSGTSRRFVSKLRCVTGEDEVVVLGRQVSGEAGFHQRLASVFAVGKVAVGGRDWLGPGAGPSPAVVSSRRSSM